MRKNQKGFTLVELIIAAAILAIVTLAVCGFIVVGSRSYTSANTDIMLQQDAQLAFNQISDVIIDTTDSISYSVGTGSSMQNVLKDSEYAGEATDKCLIVVNRNDSDSNNDNPSYWFYWNKDEETIWFNEVPVDSTMSESEIEEGFNNAEIGKAVLAQHVTEFSVDISQFEENRVVMLSAVFANGNKEYTTSNNVTVRNRIALNLISVEPMKRADDFKITGLSSVVLEPGDSYDFPFDVETTSDDKELVWELVGGTQNETTLNNNHIQIGIKETRQNLFVKVSRKNEEYAGQNDRVAVMVKVDIKRVNRVSLSSSSATVSPGETIEINRSVVGWHLGDLCNNCVGDDRSKDHDVTGWTPLDGNSTLVSSDNTKATFKIADNLSTGDTVEIEATSVLSATKNGGYSSGEDTNLSLGGVQGKITFTVAGKPKESSAIPTSDAIKFGTDNDGIMIYDYVRKGLPTQNGEYVYCVRIREKGTQGCANDWYKVYFTGGANLRFSPDSFGLDLTKSYDIYMQALYPVDIENVKNGNYGPQDDKETIWQEYSTHLDDDGKYIGEKYLAGDYYVASLGAPSVVVECNGQIYPNQIAGFHETINLAMERDKTKLGMINLDKGRTVNIYADSVLNNIRMVVYKEATDGSGNWQRVYGYGKDTQQTVSASERSTNLERIGLEVDGNYIKYVKKQNSDLEIIDFNEKQYYTEAGKNRIGHLGFDPSSSRSVYVDPNLQQGTTDADACGIYHIMVGFVYANDPDMRGGAYTDDSKLIAERIEGDFNPYYYRQWDCTINLEVTTEFNLQLPSENGKERWTDFPLPTDAEFPFARKSDYVQTITRNFTKYSELGEWIGSLDNVKVDCQYFPATSVQAEHYKIWLYYEGGRNGASYTRNVIGSYTWKIGDQKWTPDKYNYSEEVKVETNIEYTKDNTKWAAYFPYPSEANFPFKGITKDDGAKKVLYQLQSYNVYSNYDKKTVTLTVECTFDGSQYTMRFMEIVNGGEHYNIEKEFGTWTCSANGKAWTPTKTGESQKEVPVWGTIVKFGIYNGGSWFFELPLPGEAGFPSFTDTYEASLDKYYSENDECGKNPQYTWGGLKLMYTDKGDGNYEVKLVNAWNPSQVYGPWTAKKGDSGWN